VGVEPTSLKLRAYQPLDNIFFCLLLEIEDTLNQERSADVTHVPTAKPILVLDLNQHRRLPQPPGDKRKPGNCAPEVTEMASFLWLSEP